MAKKGQEKNTKNKAKHSRLVNQKKNKKKQEAELRKERLKAITKKAKESRDTNK
ncbi:hypothetical protein [Winogradskyella jejuensis]|uniref:Uncharacterized protein n=1 Tax=Winogradskyella jejuensis TaxID=1089305 RepID=A0A1M5UJC7_9FLAO|nr:hypothetical protein [Winogradskyella jejuensis]SHH63144.1 hypothetical protein SAMN05444148_2506 [Winogradskyella jejuensis]